jgi:hypothetical protein
VKRTTRQGVADLNAPGRNGRHRTAPALFGVCAHHRYDRETDEFGAAAFDVCRKCGHSRPADAGRGFR